MKLQRHSLLQNKPRLFVSLALIAGVLPTAHAQYTYDMDEMVVTAQKREQNINEVPIAINAYDGQILDELNVAEFSDLAAFVPNLEIQQQSPNNPGFVIRGITSDDGSAFVEPRVSIFQDGISISKSRGSVVELFDIDRVEVLKGPQGTLFGRGASIGAIHVIQNKPEFENHSSFSAGFGNLGQLNFEGMLNYELSEDTSAMRVATIYSKRDGYLDNIAGGDLNSKETFAIRGSYTYKTDEDSSFTLIANYQQDTPGGVSFKQSIYAPRGGDTSPFTAAELNRAEDLYIDRTVYGITGIGSWKLNENWSMKSITGYREFDTTEEFDADGSQAFALEFAENADGDQLSQELRLEFDNNGHFNGHIGLSYFDSQSTTNVPFRTDERSFYALISPLLASQLNSSIEQINGVLGQLGASPLPLLAPEALIDANGNPNVANTHLPYSLVAVSAIQQQLAAGVDYANLQLPPFSAVPTLNSYHEEAYTNYGSTKAYDIFMDGTYQVTDAFSLTGGIRFTKEDIWAGYQVAPSDTASALGMIPLLTDSAAFPNLLFPVTGGMIEADDDYTSAVGRLIAQYQWDSNQVYATLSKGRRPPVLRVDENGVTPLKNEIVWNYELGFKGMSSDGLFSYDAAVFNYNYENFQTTIVEGTRRVPVDAGSATAWGLELSGRFQLTHDVQLFANYGYIDASFDDTDVDGNLQIYAGNTFRLTPENTFAFGVMGNAFVARDKKLNWSLSYNWKDHVFFEEDNTPGIEQDAYGLLNARISVELSPGWKITAYATNLLDEEYLIDAGNTGRNFGLPTYISGAPRLYGIKLMGSW